MTTAQAILSDRPAQRWLVTGAAGFIGSHLVEALLRGGQHVVALDDFSTGHRRNLEDVRAQVGEAAWLRFRLVEGDVADPRAAAAALSDVDHVLHQAALGSVPRSIEQPMRSFHANATGFAQLLTAAKDAGVRRVVYASSSSVYGDHPDLPKVEDRTGKVLSPYAATKAIDEVLAGAFARSYRMQAVGLRYVNVFGPRQDPDGAYAAVIPKWSAAFMRGETLWINGDGQTSRDFCYVDNVVQANLRSALVAELPTEHEVFNVAFGTRTTLLELAREMHVALQRHTGRTLRFELAHREFRGGDVRHSLADIGKARTLLGYAPTHDVHAGLDATMAWYAARLA
ncbi:MAG: NAD-dependent epimerase/dehydratase family protein [Burkholderiales bacterium]